MLNDINLKNSYTTGLDEPKEFFTEALIESKKFDLGLGFFSSSGIRVLAPGFAVFIANGGVMRVIINQILSSEDKKAIESGQSKIVQSIEDKIISNIDALTNTLSKVNEFFFKCFSYLISIERIEFVATVSTKGGLAHDKYGIFTDETLNKIAFIGSANWSESALEYNGETITAFSSWKDNDRIMEYQTLFDSSWDGDTPHLIRIPMSKVKTHISGKFPTQSIIELLKEGIDIREIVNNLAATEENKEKPLSQYIITKIDEKVSEPRFPFPKERNIQKNAYNAWQNNNHTGIFAMATGSGKTVTALNCLLKEYYKIRYYKAIIVVPTQALALQWETEVKSFNFQNVISTHTDKNWENDINRYVTRCLLDKKRNIIIITTYATFNRPIFQNFIKKVNGIEEFVYIADEAHNLGSKTSLKYLPNNVLKRIGLSATPERVYDDIGSEEICNFFHSKPPLYTYRYTMKQAIDDKILCSYEYYPIFVKLTNDEMDCYKKITRDLCKFIDPYTGKYSDEASSLLLKRKRIVHKAQNKKVAVLNLLKQLKENKRLDYTFVFVPEGFEPDYSVDDSFEIEAEDIHIIDEYAEMFKRAGYTYHKYISGLADSQGILTSFLKGDIEILLSMKCLDEGVDVPRAEHAIFCSSTGNPRQFVQRRGRVLRKHKEKERAYIWDLIIIPPEIDGDNYNVEKNMFIGEVKRIINFAVLAEEHNKIKNLYGDLKDICYQLNIDLFEMVEQEVEKYN